MGYDRIGYHYGTIQHGHPEYGVGKSKSMCVWGLVYGLSPLSTDLSSGNGRRICPSSHEPITCCDRFISISYQSRDFHHSSLLLIEPFGLCLRTCIYTSGHSLENSSVKLEDRHLLHLLAAPHQTPLSSSLPYHVLTESCFSFIRILISP